MKGKLFVIVAPSGTGKSTIIKKILQEFKNVRESVSYTTRSIREGEVDGVDYNFVTKKEFQKKLDAKEFLEWAEVHGNFYGTSWKLLKEEINAGLNVLCDVDVQGADSMKKHFKEEVKIIFIAPPSIEELENRLRHRGTENTSVINLRLLNAKSELSRQDDYDYKVLNDDLDKAFERIKSLLSKLLES